MAVIGSGIMAVRLSPDDVGLQLLENAAATAGALIGLILLGTLAEKPAHKRLRALAKLDGSAPAARPAVLFLCVHNPGRSQLATSPPSSLSRGPMTSSARQTSSC